MRWLLKFMDIDGLILLFWWNPCPQLCVLRFEGGILCWILVQKYTFSFTQMIFYFLSSQSTLNANWAVKFRVILLFSRTQTDKPLCGNVAASWLCRAFTWGACDPMCHGQGKLVNNSYTIFSPIRPEREIDWRWFKNHPCVSGWPRWRQRGILPQIRSRIWGWNCCRWTCVATMLFIKKFVCTWLCMWIHLYFQSANILLSKHRKVKRHQNFTMIGTITRRRNGWNKWDAEKCLIPVIPPLKR